MKNTGKIEEAGGDRHVPNCLGCGKDNPWGFGLRFAVSGNEARSELKTGGEHEGPAGFVHGGAIALLLDEAAAVLASARAGNRLMTAKIEVLFKSPAPVGETLSVFARAVRPGESFFLAEGEVRGEDSRLVAEGRAWFIRRPAEKR